MKYEHNVCNQLGIVTEVVHYIGEKTVVVLLLTKIEKSV